MKKQNKKVIFLPLLAAAVLLSFLQPVSPAYGAGPDFRPQNSKTKSSGINSGTKNSETQNPVSQNTRSQNTVSQNITGDPNTQETEVVFDKITNNESRSVDTELLGTIDVALLSVTMPADGFEFQVNPADDFDAATNPGGQITSPTNLTVTNNSVVPVLLEIAEVADIETGDVDFHGEKFPGGPDQSFRLVDQISKVGNPGTAILVLGIENVHYRDNADFEQYAIYPGRTGIEIARLTAVGTAGESATLQLYGKVAADFYGSYQFTVRPTLKISAVRASQHG